jgi:hypothetical protein
MAAPRSRGTGVLFGLGFDTASEVALLAMTAGAAAGNLPIPAVLWLPILFAAGMSIMDTTARSQECAHDGNLLEGVDTGDRAPERTTDDCGVKIDPIGVY